MENKDINVQGSGMQTSEPVGASSKSTVEAPMGQQGESGQGLASRLQENINPAVEKASQRLKETTSRGVDRVTMYFKERDSQAIMQDVQQMVRQHPGRSLLGGILLGLVVGRILR